MTISATDAIDLLRHAFDGAFSPDEVRLELRPSETDPQRSMFIRVNMMEDGSVRSAVEHEELAVLPKNAQVEPQRYGEFARGFAAFLSERWRSRDPAWTGDYFAWRVLKYFEVELLQLGELLTAADFKRALANEGGVLERLRTAREVRWLIAEYDLPPLANPGEEIDLGLLIDDLEVGDEAVMEAIERIRQRRRKELVPHLVQLLNLWGEAPDLYWLADGPGGRPGTPGRCLTGDELAKVIVELDPTQKERVRKLVAPLWKLLPT